MAENTENKKKLIHGVVVEYDFTVQNGAELLYKEAEKLISGEFKYPFNMKMEAMHLYGGNYQGGLAEYIAEVKGKRDPAKAAKSLNEAFNKALAAGTVAALTDDFKAFIKVLVDKGVKVIISTRGNVEALKAALAGINDELVAVHQETSLTYGSCKWDAWKRASHRNGVHEMLTAAIAGSGFSSKAALVAGMSSLGVVNPHVAWQDFYGADYIVEKVDKNAAELVLKMLKVH